MAERGGPLNARTAGWAERAIVSLGLLCVLGVGLGPAAPAGAQPSDSLPVYDHYAVDGAWAVEVDEVVYDSGQHGFIYRPVPNVEGERFPVLVWGNGSGSQPEIDYPALLRSIASHGFVITATRHEEVGSGAELAESLAYVQAATEAPDSPLFALADVDRVGVFGHSQGAGGSTKLASVSPDVDTAVLLALPARLFAFEPWKRFDTADVAVPTLLLAGTLDIPISPELVNIDHYNRLAGPAAMAMIDGADHLEFSGDGGVSRPYVIAWFDYRLRDDPFAATAFVGDDPEIARHGALTGQRARGLSAPAPAPEPTPAPDVDLGTAAPTSVAAPPAEGRVEGRASDADNGARPPTPAPTPSVLADTGGAAPWRGIALLLGLSALARFSIAWLRRRASRPA